jgi:hypothetical protein
MKKIILFTTLFLSVVTFAQDAEEPYRDALVRKHEVKVGAVKLLAGPILEGTYEYIKNDDFTFGASILYNFVENSDYPEDFSITPFARFYFQERKQYGAQGFFVEGFAKYATGRNWDYEPDYDYDLMVYVDEDKKYNAGALGLALGKKWINRTGFVFEVLLGAGRTIGGSESAPDVIFRGDLNLGYRF